ncbi:MAG: TetR/AcrR family transcriptional regulator [Pseudomonadales bacterium]|nr:TetR/AcrR family transcriptional regulator [Pseudomonadales bacterium]
MSNTAKTKPQTIKSAGRPTVEKALEIETKLLRVALAEFLEYGYGDASLTRIVKNASVSKTTLYSRYSSKEELFRAIIYQQINLVNPGAYLPMNASSLNLEDGLKSYANNMLSLNLQGEMLGVNRLIYSEFNRFPELGAAAAERTRMGVERITRFIKSCTEADGSTCNDPAAAAETFIYMIKGWYIDVMLTHQTITPAMQKQWVERTVHSLVAASIDW